MWEKYLDIFHIWQLLNFPSRGKIRIGASTQPSTTSHLVFSNGFKVFWSENPQNDSGQSLQKLRTIIVFLSLSRRIPQRPSIRRSDITLADWKSDQLGSLHEQEENHPICSLLRSLVWATIYFQRRIWTQRKNQLHLQEQKCDN